MTGGGAAGGGEAGRGAAGSEEGRTEQRQGGGEGVCVCVGERWIVMEEE